MLWSSPVWATQIDDELSQAHIRYPHREIRGAHPITGEVLDLGGTRPGDEAARLAGWHGVLTLLAAATR